MHDNRDDGRAVDRVLLRRSNRLRVRRAKRRRDQRVRLVSAGLWIGDVRVGAVPRAFSRARRKNVAHVVVDRELDHGKEQQGDERADKNEVHGCRATVAATRPTSRSGHR